MDKYESKTIEEKWQRVWADARAFSVSNDDLTDRALKSYVLEMLPYPSGTLHMGHVLVYTIGDVLTHYRRRSGLRVLRPMGYDSFGLPADYAQQLLDDMEGLDWPERILAMQRHWIGRSDGAELVFRVEELELDLPVFTTRPDTIFGATFFVIAPEHPLVERLAQGSPNEQEMREYVRATAAKRAEERLAAEEKTGVFTGWFATNPVNEARIPVWIADYVLIDYGTGAIMAVPAHDERDYEFAKRFDLPVKTAVAPADGEAA